MDKIRSTHQKADVNNTYHKDARAFGLLHPCLFWNKKQTANTPKREFVRMGERLLTHLLKARNVGF